MDERKKKQNKKKITTFADGLQVFIFTWQSCPILRVKIHIENNKVRRYVVKYLEKRGHIRVQKSIFLADLATSVYQETRRDLMEVQAAYDNDDSIMIVAISTELLKSMKIIGQNIDLEVITHTKNSLFF